jgi:hypothetical protein
MRSKYQASAERIPAFHAGSIKGRKHSEEARKAISKANAGRKWSEQSRVNFRDIAIERERKKRVQNDKQLF